MNPSTKRAPESSLGYSAARDLDAVYTKIAKRIVPFLALLFLMAWLDRYNLGFAKLQMVKDLGFSESVYGFGAGIVYLGYMLFEVPSNLLLERIGARKTFARALVRPFFARKFRIALRFHRRYDLIHACFGLILFGASNCHRKSILHRSASRVAAPQEGNDYYGSVWSLHDSLA